MDGVLELIRAIEIELNKAYIEELPIYENSKLQAQLKYDSWLAEVKKVLQESSPLIRPDDTYEPVKPIRPRILLMDTTIEEAAQILSKNQKGLILVKDELSGLIENFTRRGGSDRAFYLESFGGRSYTIDRVKHPEPIIIPSLALSILGGIQPERLDSLVLKGDDDGFAARFLYIWPKKVTPCRPKHVLNTVFLKNFFQRLYELPIPINEDNAHSPRILRLTEEAIVMFSNWRQEHVKKRRKISKFSFITRWEIPWPCTQTFRRFILFRMGVFL
jgi:hypothetical protein